MVIQSPFKDYYDFVANRYGGGDPRIVYARNSISIRNQYGWPPLNVAFNGMRFADPSTWPASDAHYELAYAIVAGCSYLLSRRSKLWPNDVNTWRLADPEEIQKRDSERKGRPRRRRFSWKRGFGAWPRQEVEFGKQYPELVQLSRLVKHPVFIVTAIRGSWRGPNTIVVAGQCPVLATLGFPSLIAPEQMYQNLAYFMGNTMNVSPDKALPVEVSNREKILKAGFDLKQSFRHRV
jgi:hypothetical protein